ncbi:hypothetical protein EGN72_12580 [Pseudorhodobacter sp. E13]|nr:hypothetical protein EGN72_12580 [Pseudorhodobacter sp. E13]
MPYPSWSEVFDIDGSNVSQTSTMLALLNTDGTHTRVLGTGLTYSGTHLIGGTITGLALFDPNTSTVLVSYLGMSRPVVDVLADLSVIEDVTEDFAQLSAFFDFESSEDPATVSPSLFESVDSAGNVAQFIGTNLLTSSGDFNFATGVITEVRILNSNGVQLGTTGPVSYNLGLFADGFDGPGRYLINSAAGAASNIYYDPSYSTDDNYLDILPGSVAKTLDLNSSGFFLVGYVGTNGLIADLGAGTVIRDGVTDTYTGSPTGFGLLDGSPGDDIITMGGNVFKGVFGAGGNDSILGSSGNDQIEGGDGADTIEGGAGGDAMWGNGYNYGDSDEDTLAYTTSDAGVTINLTTQTASGGHANGDFIQGFTHVLGSDHGDDLTGSDAGNTLRGNAGNDRLSGVNGNDILVGSAGLDSLFGGNGADRLFGGQDADILAGGSGDDEAFGGDSSDVIYGNDGNDTLDGGSGEDDMSGGNGNDRMSGGDDNDLMRGGNGDDRLDGDDNNDVMAGNNGNDTLLGGDGDDRLFGGADADLLAGGNGDDLANGGSGADLIYGNSGLDSLYGGDGGDELSGGNDNDRLWGGNDLDTMRGGNGDDEMFGGNGEDLLAGNLGNDSIYGDSGNDSLFGGGGDDFIFGGSGSDRMNGGAGADVFVFTAVTDSIHGAGRDVITDFAHGVDKIDLSGLAASLTFVGASYTGTGTAGEVRYNAAIGRVYVDLTGSGASDFSIDLDGAPTITVDDFILA